MANSGIDATRVVISESAIQYHLDNHEGDCEDTCIVEEEPTPEPVDGRLVMGQGSTCIVPRRPFDSHNK